MESGAVILNALLGTKESFFPLLFPLILTLHKTIARLDLNVSVSLIMDSLQPLGC